MKRETFFLVRNSLIKSPILFKREKAFRVGWISPDKIYFDNMEIKYSLVDRSERGNFKDIYRRKRSFLDILNSSSLLDSLVYRIKITRVIGFIVSTRFPPPEIPETALVSSGKQATTLLNQLFRPR